MNFGPYCLASISKYEMVDMKTNTLGYRRGLDTTAFGEKAVLFGFVFM